MPTAGLVPVLDEVEDRTAEFRLERMPIALAQHLCAKLPRSVALGYFEKFGNSGYPPRA